MSMEVHEIGQLNVVIDNVIATDEEVMKLRAGLLKEFSKIKDLNVALEGMARKGRRHLVRFSIPGPLHFDDRRLMDVLYAVPLVGWSIEYDAGPKGQTPVL